jgi:hypothetical protein
MKRSWINRGTKGFKAKPKSKEAAWSKQVRERDNHICQRCKGQGIHAHHIAPRGRRPDLKFDVNNGITLCHQCHDWTHLHPAESTRAGFLSDVPYENRGYYKERLREVKLESDFELDVMEIF